MHGWTGRLLRVDLSKHQIREEAIPEPILHQFIGGKGLGTYFLYKEVPARIDPLGADNRIYLAAGPAQGTRIPITGRCILKLCLSISHDLRTSSNSPEISISGFSYSSSTTATTTLSEYDQSCNAISPTIS